ncbi:MAG: hypothetical protein ACRBB2_02795 [Nitrosopumilus sp.]
MNLKILASVIGTVISVLLVSFTDESIPINTSESNSVNFDNAELTIETNGVKHIIPLDKIKGGGPPKDGIPS